MTAAVAEPGVREVDWRAYIADVEVQWPGLLGTPSGRRILTRNDPLLSALLYFRHHLKDADGQITLSEFHLTICEQTKQWIRQDAEPEKSRDAYISPRDAGKSTWFFLILPMWAAAHGHRKFAAAFADAAEQAERHLKTFKNELLRKDYPALCTPARRRQGSKDADTRNMYIAQSRFVFGAKGIDAAALGMKVGSQRPDLIILDDIEPGEGNYSGGQKEKRLKTVVDDIFPMNIRARVVIVGTVTIPGSIMHDIVKLAKGSDAAPQWVRDEHVECHHHYKALITDEVTGEQRSLWPANAGDSRQTELICSGGDRLGRGRDARGHVAVAGLLSCRVVRCSWSGSSCRVSRWGRAVCWAGQRRWRARWPRARSAGCAAGGGVARGTGGRRRGAVGSAGFSVRPWPGRCRARGVGSRRSGRWRGVRPSRRQAARSRPAPMEGLWRGSILAERPAS